MNAMRPDVMDALRAQTQPIHERLESSDLISANLASLAGVATLVRGLIAFHRTFEEAVAARSGDLDPLGFETSARAKLPLLYDDAARLGLCAGDDGVSAAEMACARPLAETVGRMYVAEGSTHGGVFIGRDIELRLGFRSRYYTAYGDRTAERWRAFGAAVRAYDAAHPEDREAILRGGLQGFDAFATALTRAGATEPHASGP